MRSAATDLQRERAQLLPKKATEELGENARAHRGPNLRAVHKRRVI
jgi:hypothetical protein